MMNLSLGQHGKVFYLGPTQWRAVGGDEDHLGLAFTKGFYGAFVAKDGFSGLHDEFDT